MRKELGKFFIDVAKLTFAGVVIAALMKDIDNVLLVTFIGSLSVIGLLCFGLILLNDKEDS